jgi:peroxiredoxin Q/BCP
MTRILICTAAFFLPVVCFGETAATVGTMAPEFELPGSDGKTYKLSDFKGKSAVVVAWFPKAFTGG